MHNNYYGVGYVVFEMSTGKQVQGFSPREDDYSCVQDVRCVTSLQYIFARKEKSKSFKHTIEEVRLLVEILISFLMMITLLNRFQSINFSRKDPNRYGNCS